MSKEKRITGGSLSHNLRCAANLEHIEGSCLTLDDLKALSITYNKALEDKKIKGNEIKLVNNKEYMIQQLNERFKNCKGEQLCWLKQDFIEATKNQNNIKSESIDKFSNSEKNITDDFKVL